MGKVRLNAPLLAKMAKKFSRGAQGVREGISHRASRWRVVPQAAQLIWAAEMGISTTGAFGTLPPHVQQQVREHGNALDERTARRVRTLPAARRRSPARKGNGGLREAVNELITDSELKDRCADTLKGARKFDRAVNQATLVLEARLRKISGAGKGPKAPALAAKVLHPDSGMLRLSEDRDVQEGYFTVCRGLFEVFRNPTHHDLVELSCQDAISICAFVNAFLDALARGKPVDAPAKSASPPAK